MRLHAAFLAALSASALIQAAPVAAADTSNGLTDVAGLKVGHHTLAERPTGCTVVLAEKGAVAGVDVRGGAPGTRETDLLDPSNHVQHVHAIVLSGGSAFGLDAATGAVRYLEERGIGYDVRIAKVPIVPAAILFDLGMGGKPQIRPTADCGYKAALAASDGPIAEGSVGAGAGATVGKLGGPGRSTKGGLGTASIRLPDGLVVAALVAVNAVGDIVDPATGKVVAGARGDDGTSFVDVRTRLRAGALGRLQPPATPHPHENTSIGVVATNAALSKAQARKVAQMAHDGLARAIAPAHLPSDGDTIFSLSTATLAGGVDDNRLAVIGALAAEAMSDAILRAVREATGKGGVPALRDLK
jgi:L-aminopeptidase/D-esterase-like protein